MARAVGENVAVPKLATPEMLTAGPVASFTGAARRLRVNCQRASLIVRAVSVETRLPVSVWSRFPRPVPRLTALSPPALREFGEDASYRLYLAVSRFAPLILWSTRANRFVTSKAEGKTPV